MAEQEIIDLTADDREVIVVDSGDESPQRPKKRARRSPPGPSRKADANGEAHGDAAVEDDTEGKAKKARKVGRKKKRKLTVVGDEDGEIVEAETTEGSGQVSRDDSREYTEAENEPKDVSGKPGKSKSKDSMIRSLLDRLADAEDLPTVHIEDDSYRPTSDSKEKKKKKKKRKRGDSDRERTTTASTVQDNAGNDRDGAASGSDLFFVDDTPANIPADAKLPNSAPTPLSAPSTSSATQNASDSSSLLLPAHVSYFEGEDVGDGPIQIIPPPPPDSEDEDYIEYLDYDDDRRGGVARYFDDLTETAEPKSAKIVCKRCGAEGQHKTWNCPVIICLTCGVRNEHGTRSCPISKVCFTCGMKGHINRDCPNRYARRGHMSSGGFNDCDRCGSENHQKSECPTLWRMYTYVEESERLEILAEREQKRELDIGEGGEGYIGPEDWCYNCGDCGHLGDDCQANSLGHDRPLDPSAFSTYNINTGPFADAKNPQPRKPGKAASYAARASEWGDGHGYVLPLDVGKQGRKKEKARMERRAQEAQDDDGDDWFARRGGNRGRDRGKHHCSGGGSSGGGSGGGGGGGTPKGPRHGSGRAKTKIAFGELERDDGRFGARDPRARVRYDDLPGPSRETDAIQIRGASKRDRERERGGGGGGEWDGSIRGAARRQHENEYERRGKDRERDRERDRYGDRRRDRDRREASPRREPRYRGGYSR
ncbi:hypothetical protein PsYK624_035730 [Phanerochaete sordida]|uniref:CCHC-type domain-containing protein n=1 Tax=Phanerochaete sordida TaxID=48140 RepID=A0A9P3L9U0_9APHY|nr:hypothetical protein PsYK624_035730 [Phanerochaete sordida]